MTQNTYQRGFAQMYHSCGGKDGRYEALVQAREIAHRPNVGGGAERRFDCRRGPKELSCAPNWRQGALAAVVAAAGPTLARPLS
ncbi:MAG TPA: hypothetical protein VFX28_03765 [Methylomirabilota bacterium]|nr:hypothetical protein [Methylomirabilota bacterium]